MGVAALAKLERPGGVAESDDIITTQASIGEESAVRRRGGRGSDGCRRWLTVW